MKTVKFVFCAICIVFASADTKPHVFGLTGVKLAIDPLIFGGRDALEGQFPYQVSLRERVSGQHFCGGSIISNRFILSAAHCLDGDNSQPKSVYAVVGALHLSQGGVRVDINKITQHEKWDRSKIISDIALLRTASEFAFSNIIRPIGLPTQNLPAEGKTPVLLSGWGKNSISVRSPRLIQINIQRFLAYIRKHLHRFPTSFSRIRGKDRTFYSLQSFTQSAWQIALNVLRKSIRISNASFLTKRYAHSVIIWYALVMEIQVFCHKVFGLQLLIAPEEIILWNSGSCYFKVVHWSMLPIQKTSF